MGNRDASGHFKCVTFCRRLHHLKTREESNQLGSEKDDEDEWKSSYVRRRRAATRDAPGRLAPGTNPRSRARYLQMSSVSRRQVAMGCQAASSGFVAEGKKSIINLFTVKKGEGRA